MRLEYVKDGQAELHSVDFAGTLEAWSENRKLIEFVGDSITCGYGSVSNDDKKDGSRTFAYLTAEELGGEEAAGIYTVNTTKNNDGGHSHPSYASHQKTSEDLLAFINSKGLI